VLFRSRLPIQLEINCCELVVLSSNYFIMSDPMETSELCIAATAAMRKRNLKASNTNPWQSFLWVFLVITVICCSSVYAEGRHEEPDGNIVKLETDGMDAASAGHSSTDELAGLCGIRAGLTSVSPDWSCDGTTYGPDVYCNRDGITCTGGVITKIDLSGHSLAGIISPLIGKLVDLETLWLTDGNLQGVLPTDLGLLVKLESFDASYNLFSGELPTQIALMGSLTDLHCHSCNLNGVLPTQLGDMANPDIPEPSWQQVH